MSSQLLTTSMIQQERSTSCAANVRRNGRRLWPLIIVAISLSALCIDWQSTFASYWAPDSRLVEEPIGTPIDAVVNRIIGAESDGDPNAKKQTVQRHGAWTISQRDLARHDPSASPRFG